MRGYARGLAGLVLGLGMVTLIGTSGADDKKPPEVPADVIKGVLKMAESLDKNPGANLGKEVTDLKKFELKQPMRLFKKRESGGLGVGPKPGAIEPDGIDKMLDKLAGGTTKAELAKDGDAIKEMGNRLAAIAAIAQSRAPAKDDGKKKVKDWVKWSADMKAAGIDLAKAKDPEAVKKAAAAAANSCTKCHDIFRDDE